MILPDKTLFGEGAWLHTLYTAGKRSSQEKAESLLRLGRYAEALEAVPGSSPGLRGEILMALGKHGEAAKLLKNGDPLLLAGALKGTGRIREALGVLEAPENRPTSRCWLSSTIFQGNRQGLSPF